MLFDLLSLIAEGARRWAKCTCTCTTFHSKVNLWLPLHVGIEMAQSKLGLSFSTFWSNWIGHIESPNFAFKNTQCNRFLYKVNHTNNVYLKRNTQIAVIIPEVVKEDIPLLTKWSKLMIIFYLKILPHVYVYLSESHAKSTEKVRATFLIIVKKQPDHGQSI